MNPLVGMSVENVGMICAAVAVVFAIAALAFVAFAVRTGGPVRRCPVCKMYAKSITENEQMCARGHSFDMQGELLPYSRR